MKDTREITAGAMMSAVCIVIMLLGAIIDSGTYAASLLASVPNKNNPNIISVGEGGDCFWKNNMSKIISCEFNIDTACVEFKYLDGSMIPIDCTCVECGVARNSYEASELDWLLYNAPVGLCEFDTSWGYSGVPKECNGLLPLR